MHKRKKQKTKPGLPLPKKNRDLLQKLLINSPKPNQTVQVDKFSASESADERSQVHNYTANTLIQSYNTEKDRLMEAMMLEHDTARSRSRSRQHQASNNSLKNESVDL